MPLKLFRKTGFLTAGQCASFRRAMNAGVAEQAEILKGGSRHEAGVRRATLIEPADRWVADIEARFDACRSAVGASLGLMLGEREGAGFVRYATGGFYRPHRDRGDDPQWGSAARRAAALVLFLNTSREPGLDGDFDGGLLRLLAPSGAVDVSPQAGLLVAFPADVLHEVTEVRNGIRDAIVDWFYDA